MMPQMVTSVFGGTCRLSFQGRRACILKIEAAGSSETVVTIYQATELHITEDNSMKIHRHENLRSYMSVSIIGIEQWKLTVYWRGNVNWGKQDNQTKYRVSQKLVSKMYAEVR
jgi:hypothetical protein